MHSNSIANSCRISILCSTITAPCFWIVLRHQPRSVSISSPVTNLTPFPLPDRGALSTILLWFCRNDSISAIERAMILYVDGRIDAGDADDAGASGLAAAWSSCSLSSNSTATSLREFSLMNSSSSSEGSISRGHPSPMSLHLRTAFQPHGTTCEAQFPEPEQEQEPDPEPLSATPPGARMNLSIHFPS